MLSFFRNVTKSRIGVIFVFLVLGVIALAFAASDVSGVRTSGAGGGTVVARVGDHEITDIQLRAEVDRFLAARRREGAAVTMDTFLANNGLELVLQDMIDAATLEQFARRSGMRVSPALIDSEIANDPRFHGYDGKFSQRTFDSLLSQNRITAAALRADIARSRYIGWLLGQPLGAAQIPNGVVLPYASLQLERRRGTLALVRTIDMDPGAEPDDRTLTSYYNTNRARYLIPERRILRYAMVTPANLTAQSAATEAEIAQAYSTAGARFAATEKRTIRQLILPDQATANRVAGEARGGQTLDQIATASGLLATSFDAVEKPALVTQTNQVIADAAFAAAEGAVVGPVRSPRGWHVLRVETVQRIAARSLDQAREELAAEISSRKLVAALVALRQRVDDAIGGGSTFDELVADSRLTGVRTPAIVANGTDPDNAGFALGADLAPVLTAGFAAEQGDDPQLVPIGQEGSFAVVAVERIVPAAPRPLAGIRAQVRSDYMIAQALQKARQRASELIAQINRGTPVVQVLDGAGIRPSLRENFDRARSEIGADAAPEVRMAFSMAPRRAKLVEAANRAGYYIVYLDAVEEHSAADNQVVLEAKRAELVPQAGPEQVAQFVEAIKRYMNVWRNEEALARLKAQLGRTGAG